jgi:hypothetical protein
MKMAFWGAAFIGLLLVESKVGAQNTPGRPLCLHQTTYGGKRICMPRVRGYEECSSHPVIAQLNESGFEGQTILGFYLDTALFRELDREPLLNNYWKVYTTDALATNVMKPVDLHEAADELSLYFLRENWEEIRDDLLSGQFPPLKRPILLKRYSPQPEVVSLSLLVELPPDGATRYLLYNLNMLLVNQRLIWMSYHQLLQQSGQLALLQDKNDELIRFLMEANPDK